MANLDQCIIDKAKDSWEEEFIKGTKNKDNCSGFVKAVAKIMGIYLPATANADGIIDHISLSWKKLESGADAARLASTGAFVVAGLKAANHTPAGCNGHVAIVVSGKLYREKYPVVWGGSTGGAQSQGDKSVGEVWNRKDRDKVVYYSYSALVCNK
jgi:cell wall-associated NlpC family hydrolase